MIAANSALSAASTCRCPIVFAEGELSENAHTDAGTTEKSD